MKTSHDPRHKSRIIVIQELFAWELSQQRKFRNKVTEQIVNSLEVIDPMIKRSAQEWPIGQINKIDLSILRLAVFELIIKKDVPYKVVVDEAVELAKEFGSESSPGFINGVLGDIIKNLDLEKEEI